MLFGTKTQKWSELAKTLSMGYPEWSRNGDYVYFLSAPAGQPSGIFRVRISDHKLEQVSGLKDFRQASGFGAWVGQATDDSLLVVRDAGTQDIYALDVDFP
jgi:hypothetical protein